MVGVAVAVVMLTFYAACHLHVAGRAFEQKFVDVRKDAP